ncbi:hypothetical protein Lfu02_57840 [Longispora fulva]|uniref:Putative RNase H-like HicB family nuclease n=1 Tax=Longispora fulva TaxID=619741 RepID=A0A8J7KGD7_9ACTN|nr:hypothetical protein [Longispora fulva]MBG6137235.1 putative RNase H-like HicB family nuclease [Longispora fulva]GIG61412.1 hypothetical protein Lfu02_57840 [Longispora fulva]
MSDLRTIDVVMAGPIEEGIDDWTVYSPQIPGFTGGRKTRDELRAALPEMLEFVDVDVPRTRIHLHEEHVYRAGDLDYLIRVRRDDQQEPRVHTARVLERVLTDPVQRAELLSGPRTRTGEVLFICALATDRLGDLADQLHGSGDVAAIVAPVGEDMIWSARLANADDLLEEGHPPEYWGWSRDMTIAELMRSTKSGGHPNVLMSTSA